MTEKEKYAKAKLEKAKKLFELTQKKRELRQIESDLKTYLKLNNNKST